MKNGKGFKLKNGNSLVCIMTVCPGVDIIIAYVTLGIVASDGFFCDDSSIDVMMVLLQVIELSLLDDGIERCDAIRVVFKLDVLLDK